MKQQEHQRTASRNTAILFILQLALMAGSSFAQEQKPAAENNHVFHYGLQLGFTESKMDLYFSQNGEAHALEEGSSSFFAPGFNIGTVFGFQIGQSFQLRAMPTMTLINRNWDPSGITVVPTSPAEYTISSVCAVLPVDVKFCPFNADRWRPYISSGIGYSLDFNSLRKDNSAESIHRLNTHNLDYTCGLGVDWLTKYLNVGIELKANFGIIPPHTNNTNSNNLFHFHSTPTFSIGIVLWA